METRTLTGPRVTLAPLRFDHVDALAKIALQPGLWRFVPSAVRSRDDMRAYVESALQKVEAGTAVAFTTTLQATGEIVGCTRFGEISERDKRAQIGWTWIAPNWQGSFVNTEAKWLMLHYAFEHWHANRVELKTDARNIASRKAILKLGATEEGILRQHMVLHDGYVRDTVYYSIIQSEWPQVDRQLRAKIAVGV